MVLPLPDLVSYKQRHNEANGENNRDGHHENFSGITVWKVPVMTSAASFARPATA